MSEKLKIIAHYLPQHVAHLYIAYVADILPFVKMLHVDQSFAPETAKPNLVWGDEDTLWHTNQVTEVLAHKFKKRMSVQLTLFS